jgi:hypothetical protein
VSAENQHRPDWNFFNRLNEDRAAPPQLVYHVAVMNNFMVDVNWPPVSFQRQFHDVHRAHNPSAKTARADSHQRFYSACRALNVSQIQ